MLTPIMSQTCRVCVKKRARMFLHPRGNLFPVRSRSTRENAFGLVTCKSMRGWNVSYKDALQNNLEKILTLPDETIICPGHGPMTAVGEEKRHNPFFAAKI